MNTKDWDFGFAKGFEGFGMGFGRHRHRGRRQQMFEAGEVKFIILRLLREKPRHGYDIIKELEDRSHGCYTPSAGTIYPTLQLLEDQGLVRSVEEEGKKVYHITPAGEQFLDEQKQTVDDIMDRVKEAVRGFAGGSMADLNSAFGQLARQTFGKAWRAGPDDEKTRRIVEILRKAVADVEAV